MPLDNWRFGLRRGSGVTGYALRVALLCAALATVVFGALAFADLISETPAAVLPLNIALYFVFVGVPIVLGGLALWAPIHVLRATALALALGYLAELAVWALLAPEQYDAHGDVWILSFTAIPAALAVMGRPRPSTWWYLPVLGLLAGLVTYRTSSSDYRVWDGLLTGAYDATFAALFVGSVYVALVWTEQLDARLAEEVRAQSASLADEARLVERRRFEALVHDGVISTLLMAARDAAPADRLAAQAKTTLEQLVDQPLETETDSHALEERLRLAILASAPEVEWHAAHADALVLPSAVAEALRGALAEAVRNAIRHASGPTASPIVSIRVSFRVERERVIIRVADDGVGFNPDRVEAGRMGIRHSIRARMSAVGGCAEIHSRPGAGTTVELRWPGDTK